MNYEIKSVRPASVFANAIRVFVVVGFIAAIYSFFISPYSGIRLVQLWQKNLATILFSLVYAVVLSIIAWFVARVYNAYLLDFDPSSLLMYNVTSFLIPAFFMGLGKVFTNPSWASFGSGVVVCLVVLIAGSLLTTVFILLWRSIFGPSEGLSAELGENSADPQS